MIYVQRDDQGKINAISLEPQYPGMEELSSQSEELLEFIKKCGRVELYNQILAESDNAIARVLEDLIDLLIEKKIIMATELPLHAQKKLQHRKMLRQEREKIQLLVDYIV